MKILSLGEIRTHHARWRVTALALAVTMLLTLSTMVLPTWTVAADTAAPQQAALGTPVTFSGSGFKPSESLSLWQIGPDGSITPLSGLQTDANGAFTTSVSFPIAGQWLVTAHSIATGNEVFGSYTVGTTASTTPATTIPSNPPVFAPPTNAPAPATPQTAIGAPVPFSGTGFTANEAISLWETGPDSTVTPLQGIGADASGAFSTSITFPSAGQWQVTAHGITSGYQKIGAFTIGTGGSAPAATNGTGSNAAQVAVGAPVTVSGTGFTANEAISLWTTSPTGSVNSLGGSGADGVGAFTTTVSFASAGQWQVTAHGITSGKETIRIYTVGTTAGAAPAASGVGSNAPQVAVGSAVVFSGTGFSSAEPVSFWMTGPDTTVTSLSGNQSDANGAISASVSFPSVGYWQVTAHGQSSGREVITGYNVTGNSAAAVTAPSAFSPTGASIPINLSSGTAVNVTAAGFTANEIVNAWVTGPDGSVTALQTTQASPTGQVSFTTSFASAGSWQVTAHGKDSGHNAISQYQVAASAVAASA